MQISQINPHIRYARAHFNKVFRRGVSFCYDCRLFFIREGVGAIEVNGEKYNFSNNTVIFLPGGTRYQLMPDLKEGHMINLVFNFDLINDFSHLTNSLGTANEKTFMEGKIIRYDMPEEFSHIIVQNAPVLFESLQKCTDMFLTQDPYYRETASAILKYCLLQLLKANSTGNAKITDLILEHVHHNYHDPELNNKQIADAFNYHPHYVNHLIKQETGQTLHNYLLHYRVRMAKNMLATTDLAINTIAWKSGFNSVSHFIKTFRVLAGMTPRQYRQTKFDLYF